MVEDKKEVPIEKGVSPDKIRSISLLMGELHEEFDKLRDMSTQYVMDGIYDDARKGLEYRHDFGNRFSSIQVSRNKLIDLNKKMGLCRKKMDMLINEYGKILASMQSHWEACGNESR